MIYYLEGQSAMNDGIEQVREVFQGAEEVGGAGNDSTDWSPLEGFDGGARAPRRSIEEILPEGFPIIPLGQSAGKFYFLSARGEIISHAAGALGMRSNLVALISGVDDPIWWLGKIAMPGPKDDGFKSTTAADVLMEAASSLPLFDPSMPMRNFGTWRAETGIPVVHLGETIQCGKNEPRRGRMIGKALYPAVPARAFPSDVKASADDLDWIRERLQRYWSWLGDNDAALIMGWIGQAALGQFPDWRTHMWIKGKQGSGKTTLLAIISDLLGGMSSGVRNSTSAAAVRQTTNRQALARLFDEAETEGGAGQIEEVIKLFRLMSGSEGASVERGTADHAGIRFELHGAGLLASIIPGAMSPQDRSRFVMLSVNEAPKSESPADTAARLNELQVDAKELGPKVWRRMLDLAPHRWDEAFRVYNSLVQRLGARSRSGDTIGAILAGWDLMFFDDPVIDKKTGVANPDRMARAIELAQPLIAVASEAEEEGEGERCLRTLFAGLIHKDHGGVATVNEIIESAMKNGTTEDYQDKLLGRIGLRFLKREKNTHELFIANPANPLLDRVFAGTRWRGGGHRAALETIASVSPSPSPIRVTGRPTRGLIIPSRLLPGFDEPEVEPIDF
ncbi:hypothetical protein [Falsihalocynthiibacter sp. CO-5D18]|uniref:hypothetical protein n=1 Tax=Falsihalocynthiibacter sp. CO-5D18 TaxID=3240872 RepID=UPI00350ED81F